MRTQATVARRQGRSDVTEEAFMSVQFGRWNFEGSPVAQDYTKKAEATLFRYAPDGTATYSKGPVTIIYGAFHTTKNSHLERQPNTTASGAVITWDGRLDNRVELLKELRNVIAPEATDAEIVASAYEQWENLSFARLIGDWALSIWNPSSGSLVLAKDFIGSRHLFYSIQEEHVTWSTVLDPLVLCAGRTFAIEEEYIAGWYGGYPAAHLTPYVNIHAVPPSSFVFITPRKHAIRKYWDFNPGKVIRYGSDVEYEEHFRTVFSQAVRRRLRSDRPVLAELSGGIDSSSIVCVADIVIASGQAETPRLDTISYYDGSDPVLDEQFYISIVEQIRQRAGYHIDLNAKRQIEAATSDSKYEFVRGFDDEIFAATPYWDPSLWPEVFDEYSRCMKDRQYRVMLSGAAGEDPMGGYVPSPVPELQNLLVTWRFLRLSRQLNAWAAKMGKSRRCLLSQSLREFFTSSLRFPGSFRSIGTPRWLQQGFAERNENTLHWHPRRLRPFKGLPSFQHHSHQLRHHRRAVASRHLCPQMLREIRYPYLDRDLLEFAYAIPQEQLVGVGKRRFLMKRALAGIVPEPVLNRKRRAVDAQETVRPTLRRSTILGDARLPLLSGLLGIINSDMFLQELAETRIQNEIDFDDVNKTLLLELWLRHVASSGILKTISCKEPDGTFRADYKSSVRNSKSFFAS